MTRNTIFRIVGLLAIVFVLFSVVATAQQTTYYVNVTDGDDSYTGANPSNSPAGTGPKRTLNAAITAANALSSGTAVTMHVAAGIYNRADGGNDAGGVLLTGNRNFTFTVESFAGFTTADIPGGLDVNLSTGRTATWNALTAGSEKVAVSAGAFSLTLGTLDVSGLASFTIAGGVNVTRSGGSITGAVTFGGVSNVTYTGNTKTAGTEMPAAMTTGSLTINLASNTQSVSFPNNVSFTTGGIVHTLGDATFSGTVSFTTGGIASAPATGNDVTFNALVTLTPGTGASSRIVNNGGAILTFAGGITVNARAAEGNIIDNQAGGSIIVSGPLSFVNNSTTSGVNATATIYNNAAGTVTVSGLLTETSATVSSVVYTFTVDATNWAAGTLNLGSSAGASTVNGNLLNSAASGKININGAVTLNGTLTNSNATGIIALGANTLTLNRTTAAVHTNTGKITSTGIGTGLLSLTGSPSAAAAITWDGAGDVPNVTFGMGSNATMTWTADPGAKVNGNFIQSGAGATVWTGDRAVTGTLQVSAGTLTVNSGSNTATVISGGVTLSGGTLTMGTAGLSVNGAYSQSAGTFNFGARPLVLKGNFTRTGGTVNEGTGTLQFTSGGPQSFNGGANITVNNLETATLGTAVTFGSSIIVKGNATIASGTSVALSTFNIRMDGNGATFDLGGSYTSSAGGGVLFEGGADQFITATQNVFVPGSGIFSNIEIRMDASTFNVIVPDTKTVEWSGTLTFTRGGIVVGAGASGILNPSTFLTTPSIAVNLGGAPDGTGISLNGGAFNVSGVDYNLSYFGALTADRTVGSEFLIGATGRVINLGITTTGAFKVLLTDNEYRFSGNLSISAGSTLDINGTTATKDLVSTGNNATHAIAGTLSRTAANAGFIILGTGVTVNGGSNSSSTSSQGRITKTTIDAAATVTVTGVREFTTDLTNNGTLTLGLATVTGDATSGQVTGTLTINGNLTLSANLKTPGTVTHTAGVLNFGAFNLTDSGATWTNTAGTYASAPSATTNGILILTNAAGSVDLAGADVPRITVSHNGTTTFVSSATVTDRFSVGSSTTAPAVDLGANTLTISGAVWTHTDGTYPNGTVEITGAATTLTSSADFTVPNLTVNTTGVFTIASSDNTTPLPRTVTVSGTLTQTVGTIALGFNDIALTFVGDAYVYVAGSVTATSSASLTADIGEIIFDSGGISNLNPDASGLSIPNLTINSGTMALTGTLGTETFTVANRLTFGNGDATGLATGTPTPRLIMADQSWIVRVGAGTLDAAPSFAGLVSVAYTTVSIGTGKELPTSATALKDLYIAPGGANTVTFTAASSSTPVVVNGTLSLVSGTVTYGTTRPLQMATGGTISVSAGVIDPAAAAVAPATTGGAYNLTYTGNNDITSTSQEWPSTAAITTFSVTVGGTSTDRTFTLHASRSATNFTLNAKTAGSAIDLNAKTLTVTGVTTLTKGTVTGAVGSSLVTQGDVSASGATFGANVQMSFTGSTNQTVTVPAAGASLANVTVSKTAATNTVTLTGGNLTVNGTLFLVNGVILTTGTNVVILSVASTIDRSGVTGTNVSHIAGNVRRNVTNSARVEFPTGTSTLYRPLAITVTSGLPLAGVNLTVGHVASSPTGINGLPITDGIRQGLDVARYPAFYWLVSPDAGVSPAVAYHMELTAAGFSDFDPTDANSVGIIRRGGGATDAGNVWLNQGGQADNITINNVLTARRLNAVGGLISGGAIFTYGLKSNMTVANPFTIPTLTDAAPRYARSLRNPALITGASGVISFTASITNTAIATVSITAAPTESLIVVRKVSGSATVNITATDASDGSRITYPTTITVVTAVENIGGLPTEFALDQNFPNPFNPSTTIRFALPKESPVTLVIYNVLGVSVRTLVNGENLNAANHQITWDGKDDNGLTVPSGVYLYRISAGAFQTAKKMTLLK